MWFCFHSSGRSQNSPGRGYGESEISGSCGCLGQQSWGSSRISVSDKMSLILGRQTVQHSFILKLQWWTCGSSSALKGSLLEANVWKEKPFCIKKPLPQLLQGTFVHWGMSEWWSSGQWPFLLPLPPRGSFHLGWGVVLYFAYKEEMFRRGGWPNYTVGSKLWVLSSNFNNAGKGAVFTHGPEVERALGLALGDACWPQAFKAQFPHLYNGHNNA